DDNTTERYDPQAGVWSGDSLLPDPRSEHAAVVLDTGDLFVFGGSALYSALRYSPAAGWIQATVDIDLRERGAGLRLPSGDPMIQGGSNGSIMLSSVTVHQALTNLALTFFPGDLARGGQASSLIEDGTVLTVGGSDGINPMTTVSRLRAP